MKNKSYDSIFGNRDRGLRELIEDQASTEARLDPKTDKHNVKQLKKTRNTKTRMNIRKTQ